ncbi:carboxylesterase/lipase family protein [Caulobacter sp. NIBR1757]|uniref:carboxylesterase/lipase family protein n=1 Tax=Caulobacter sp. NIBR1757 TaxID=3016000 RepID=UPI0022F07E72|nr:carboxylesterase/lipase family protein [Caulobacter sp. NIBR1757]WGM39596.1 Para-nitrobenzyl esterase [Caulobacter sp. NIBR1757]
MSREVPSLDRRRVLAGAAGLASLGLAPAAWARRGNPVVRTVHGPVRGLRQDGLLVFKGVRYGADTGPRRFQPPEAPAPWKTPLPCTAFGHASPQRGAEADQSEDCLFLNVWTPGADAARRPVMLYIHGGAYMTGSGSSPWTDGTRLAARGDVVVVTVNHRLGPFGYSYLNRLIPGFEDGGNAGMLDLVLALQWVRDNIAAFGGDPGRVMLFGQSGGGAKIATLMAMPAAKGLFHRAATMSGQQLTASGPGNATRRTLALLEALKVTPEALATLPVSRIVEALATTDPVIGSGGLYFGPVLDERTLTRHPFYPDAPPQSADVPMMIGNTRDETRGFFSDPAMYALTWDELPGKLVANMRVDIDPGLVIRRYRELYPAWSPSDVFFGATTASRSWRAAIVEAELRAAQGSPVFAYQLDWRSPKDGGMWGAPHTLDIPLVFGTLDAPGVITGTGEDARRVSELMMDAFIRFARDGDPNGGGLPAWVPYSLARRQTMVWNVEPRLVDDPRGEERRLFEKVPFVQQGT